jgi:hypothetical protein
LKGVDGTDRTGKPEPPSQSSLQARRRVT